MHDFMRTLRRSASLLLFASALVAALSVPAVPAAHAAPCTLTPSTGTSTTLVTVDALKGYRYALHVPPGISSSAPVPLLASLHGTGFYGSGQATATNWPAFASSHGFVAIFPQTHTATWGYADENANSVQAVIASIRHVLGSGCIDTSKIYVDGWSGGAYLAQRLACTDTGSADGKLPSFHLAAIASYAGGDPAGALNGPCTPVRKLSILMVHGTEDEIVNAGTEGFPAYQAWATRYGCSVGGAGGYESYHSLTSCTSATTPPVIWVPAVGFDHLQWSCATDDPKGTTHNALLWSFFQGVVHASPLDCGA